MKKRFYTHAHTFHLLWVRKNLVYILGGTINPNYKKLLKISSKISFAVQKC